MGTAADEANKNTVIRMQKPLLVSQVSVISGIWGGSGGWEGFESESGWEKAVEFERWATQGNTVEA